MEKPLTKLLAKSRNQAKRNEANTLCQNFRQFERMQEIYFTTRQGIVVPSVPHYFHSSCTATPMRTFRNHVQHTGTLPLEPRQSRSGGSLTTHSCTSSTSCNTASSQLEKKKKKDSLSRLHTSASVARDAVASRDPRAHWLDDHACAASRWFCGSPCPTGTICTARLLLNTPPAHS